ncbi:MAG: alcohol dehydrogenase catalytic domain-containing protein, partial [Sphingomonadales bacterium]
MTQTLAAVLDAMGAARPYAGSQPLRLARLALAAPGPGEVLVEIEAAGLCHSDLSVVNGDRPRPLPMALGHEAVARVQAVGPNCRLAVGARVVLAFLPACGHCAPCRSGESWLCSNGAVANGKGELLGGGRRLTEAGCAVNHHLGLSAFASHAVIDERSAVQIDDDIPAEIAALFGCAVLTGVGAVFN